MSVALGPRALRALAPEAFAALDHVEASAARALEPAVGRAVADTVAACLGASATAGAVLGSGQGLGPAAVALVEQFVLDVAATTDAQRSDALAELGPAAFDVVQVVYVRDYAARLAAAWRQLFGDAAGPGPPPGQPSGGPLWPALDAYFAAVARLRALDAVTTELVRLRGARTHDCRLCRSRRSVASAAAGSDEARYDKVDRYEASDLDERWKVALRLTDAIVWQPMSWPEGLATQVSGEFAPQEAVELVLDVARNAANKIAVALGADAPSVAEGVEYFDVDAHGRLVAGLPSPG